MRRIAGAVPSALLAWVLAWVLVAGCSAAAPGASSATFGACYAFGLQAIKRHITVTGEPGACVAPNSLLNISGRRPSRPGTGPMMSSAGAG